MEHLVYLILRDDNEPYVGTTTPKLFKQRMARHNTSTRFSGHTFTVYILWTTNDINEAYDKETKLISETDAYRNGLNLTETGRGRYHKHNTSSFTTNGLSWHKTIRKKISDTLKEKYRTGEYISWNCGKQYVLGPRPQMRGRQTSSKLTLEQVQTIRSLYARSIPTNRPIGMKMKNGIPLTYEWAACLDLGQRYRVNPGCIKKILRGETWPNGIQVKR